MGARSEKQMLASGVKAPDFRLRDAAGGEKTLSELTAEGPTLLAFYKAACPVCQLTLPYLERLKQGQIRIVAISQDDTRTTQEFSRAFRITVPVLMDEAGNGYSASNAYGISTVPSMFQVEPDGSISHAWAGWSKADMVALGDRAGAAVLKPGEQVPVFRPG